MENRPYGFLPIVAFVLPSRKRTKTQRVSPSLSWPLGFHRTEYDQGAGGCFSVFLKFICKLGHTSGGTVTDFIWLDMGMVGGEARIF